MLDKYRRRLVPLGTSVPVRKRHYQLINNRSSSMQDLIASTNRLNMNEKEIEADSKLQREDIFRIITTSTITKPPNENQSGSEQRVSSHSAALRNRL